MSDGHSFTSHVQISLFHTAAWHRLAPCPYFCHSLLLQPTYFFYSSYTVSSFIHNFSCMKSTSPRFHCLLRVQVSVLPLLPLFPQLIVPILPPRSPRFYYYYSYFELMPPYVYILTPLTYTSYCIIQLYSTLG